MGRPLRIAVLAALLLLPALPFALVFTETGTRMVLELAQRQLPVELVEPSGTLAGRLTAASLRVRQAAFDLEASGVALSLDPACLWRSAVCLPDVEADALRLAWQDGSWEQADSTLDIVLREGAIRVRRAMIEQPVLQLPGSTDTAADEPLRLPDIGLPLSLRVDELQLVDGSVDVGGQVFPVARLQLDGRWEGTQLDLASLTLDGGDLGQVTASDLRVRLSDDWPLGGQLDIDVGSAAPWPLLQQRTATVSLEGHPRAIEARVTVTGTPAVEASLSLDALDRDLPFRIDATATDLDDIATGVADALPPALADIRPVSPVRVSAEGDARRQMFSLDGLAASAGYGELNVRLRGTHSDGQLSIAEAAVNDTAGRNELRASGDLTLAPALRWSLRLESNGLELAPFYSALDGQVAGSLHSQGSLADGVWETALSDIGLSGDVNGLPATLSGNAALDSNALLVDGDLRGEINGAQVALSPRNDGSGELLLDVAVAELRRWHPRAGGALTAQATVGPAGNRLRVKGDVKRPRWGDMTATGGEFTADIDRRDNSPFTLEASLRDTVVANTVFSTLSLQAGGDRDEQSLALTMAGELAGELLVAGRGDTEAWSGQLAATTLEGDEMRWSLEDPVAINWDAGGLSLRSGALRLTRELSEDATSDVRWEQASIDATFTDGLSLDADISTGPASGLLLRARLPDNRELPLEGSLQVTDFDIGALGRLLPSLGDLRGLWNGTLLLGGTAEQPQVTGELVLSGARVSLVGNPTRLEDIELTLRAVGDRAVLQGSGLMGGGAFTLEGDLATLPEPSMTLAIKGGRHALVYPPSAEFTASQDLVLVVTGSGASITGDITVHGGEFRFEQLPEGGVNLSPDVVRVDLDTDGLDDELGLPLNLNVGVVIERGFRLTGTLLETGLSGRLQVKQAPRKPLQLFGTLATEGGTIRAFDRVLVVRRGSASFNGNPANPLVDLRAERRVTGTEVTAGLHAHGSLADNLKLDVYADPPMSEGNAMSYLIWGRAMDSGTSGEGTVMALSIAGGAVNRSSLVAALNEVPGISDLRFGADGTEDDAAATVSGFVGERLYLSWGVGLNEPINVMTARLFIQTRLWLEVVSRLENSVDLYYAFDID